MNNDLTVSEIFRHDECLKTFKECESFVDTAIECMWKLSEAYLEVKESKLYRREGTLEDWCNKHSKFGHRRIQQIVQSSKTLKSLENTKQVSLLTNSKQISAIASVPEGKREEVIEEAAKSGKITAKSIKDAAKIIDAEVIEVDKTEAKFKIPKEILKEWQRAEQVGKDLLNRASELKVILEKGKNDEDPIFREVTISAYAYAKNLYTYVKAIIPHSVCTSCQGRNNDKCTTCKGRGFFSKDFYDRAIPEEIKAIRLKGTTK